MDIHTSRAETSQQKQHQSSQKKSVVAHGLRRAMPWLIRIYVCSEEAVDVG